jgi:hypothetical protein
MSSSTRSTKLVEAKGKYFIQSSVQNIQQALFTRYERRRRRYNS